METSKSEMALYAEEIVEIADKRNLSRRSKVNDIVEILETVVKNAERRAREAQEETDKQQDALRVVRERCRT